ncbi:hypothetical protein [Phenylobacterium sp.]|uniref:hypothetical protein n=1 Tax=Phenylobacterium sp. TaxID=1871053 RepID=UPI00286C10E0|nr:hypothetical protein [Phenylobacterium sp.]
MAEHTTFQDVKRLATSLVLHLGWGGALVVMIEAHGRFGETLAQTTGFATVLFLQLFGVALLVRALADCARALTAAIFEIAAAQRRTREPVTA